MGEDSGMNKVMEALGRIEGRLGGLEGRMDGLAERMGGVEGRMDGLAERVDGLSSRVDGLSSRVERLSGRVEHLSSEFAATRDQSRRQHERFMADFLDFKDATQRCFEKLSAKIDRQTDQVERAAFSAWDAAGKVFSYGDDIARHSDDLRRLEGSVKSLKEKLES